MKCPQVSETGLVAYNTAVRITMTWMTENLHQQVAEYGNTQVNYFKILLKGALCSFEKTC